ncbi:MAG: hypothetical protein ABWW70_00465 [Thermoproteota archaeon]
MLELNAEVVEDHEQMLEGIGAIDRVLGSISLSLRTLWERLGGYPAAWRALGG